MSPDSIHAAVERYYSRAFAEHGASARGVDWNSAESQERRFDQLALLFRDEAGGFSVNDLGCGYGALATYLLGHGFDGRYTGYELSASMVEAARAAFAGEPRVQFRQGGSALDPAEFTLASGIFNVRLGFAKSRWTSYVWETIDLMARASTKGFAFNVLTSYSDVEKRRSDLYYADPAQMLRRCVERYGRHVAVLHDSGLWEFTMIVRVGHGER
jgi:SAM-dependent methyltransferase